MFGFFEIYGVVMALTFWPLLLIGVFLIGACISAYIEAISIMVFVAFVFSIIFAFDGTINIYKIIHDSPKDAIFYFLAYISIGVLWSLFKWRKHILSDAIQWDLKQSKRQATDDKDFDHNGNHWTEHYSFPSEARAKNNKERISSWIGLFPFSMMMFIIGDLLKEFFDFIYKIMSGAYDSITRYYLPK